MSESQGSQYRFVHEEAVRWSDIDSCGVLNNAVYLTFLEQTRYAYFGRLELLEGRRFPFVLAETSIRYLRPGLTGMVLAIAAGVTRLGRSSFEMDFEIRHGDDVLATARATLVYVDAAMKSRPLPATARTKIADFEGIPPGP